MKSLKKISIIIIILILAVGFISAYIYYSNLIDVQSNGLVLNEIQSDIDDIPSYNDDTLPNIKILHTEYKDDLYAVLFSYSDSMNHNGVIVFKKDRLFKNRYSHYAFNCTTDEVSYYHYSERKKDLIREFIVAYGNQNNSKAKKIVITDEDEPYYDDTVTGKFINIYDFSHPCDDSVYVYYE